MNYSLWDAEIGRFLGRYATEDEALGVVRTLVSHYGDEYAESLSLGRVADDGAVLEPLTGTELAERAKVRRMPSIPKDERRSA